VNLGVKDLKFVRDKIEKKEFLKAYEKLQKLLEIHPDNTVLYGFLGLLMFYLNDLERGFSLLKKAYEIDSGKEFVVNNYIMALLEKGLLEEAMYVYELNPSLQKNNIFALVNLMMGNFQKGLEAFENRETKKRIVSSASNFNKTLWKGESLEGKKILVVCEQGYGDTLHFSNYLPKLSQQAQKVYFLPLEKQESLFKENEKVLEVETLSYNLSWDGIEYDYYIPLMSLPNYLDSNFSDIHTLQGKWIVSSVKKQTYSSYLLPKMKKHIAICWKGNPNQSRDYWRSISYSYFLNMVKRFPQCAFYLFVFNQSEEEKQAFLNIDNVVDMSSFIDDFSDSAAFLSQLDLCISSDTSLVHLAGSLQLPTWLLLSYRPDWRWSVSFSQGLLYPSVNYIRQKKYGCWKGVFSELSQKFEHFQISQKIL
jgi:tetratricopeptide (TPR) repeat protein